MAYDRRRALLVTCSLLTLLVATTLMPAAGLGTFPSIESDGPNSGFAVTGPSTLTDDPRLTPTVTASQSTASTPAAETVTTSSTTPMQDDATTTPDGDDEDDEDDSGGLGLVRVPLLLASLLAGLGALLTGYVAFVLGLVAVFGSDVASPLPLSGRIRSIPQTTMALLIGTSSVTSSFVGRLGSALTQIRSGFAGVSLSLGGLGLRALLAPLSIGSGLAGALSRGLSTLTLSVGRRSSRDTGTATTVDARETATTGTSSTGASDPEPVGSVLGAYERMVDRLPVADASARTPTEMARAAVDAGWPATPVERLTSLFQRVRYGGHEETTERTSRARAALDRLRKFWGES